MQLTRTVRAPHFSWEIKDFNSNIRGEHPRKIGLIVRFIRFDVFSLEPEELDELNFTTDHSYFATFEVNPLMFTADLVDECCEYWNLRRQTVVLTDEYFNILMGRQSGSLRLSQLFSPKYKYLEEEKIHRLYIF